MDSSRTWSLYIHKNKLNGKCYVGITSQDPEKRWLNGYGYEKHLHFGRAIAKYGWDNFEHIILYNNLSEQRAKELEVLLIKQMETQNSEKGYNMTNGGDGVCGLKHTDESRKKMSEAKSGANHPNFGLHISESTRNKISEKLVGNQNALGVVRSEETKQKMSRSKYKPVAMYDGDTLVRIFESAKSAGEYLRINRKNISLCCYNQRKHAGGFAWKFV